MSIDFVRGIAQVCDAEVYTSVKITMGWIELVAHGFLMMRLYLAMLHECPCTSRHSFV